MEHDENGEAKWPIDIEAIVAKNVRRLREARGLSQQQLGTDLAPQGAGMHQTTVAKLEAGARPLRLNEVLAIAAYFDVPIESLWQKTGETLDDHEEAIREGEIRTVMDALEQAQAEVSRASSAQDEAMASKMLAKSRETSLAARLRGLQGLVHGEH